MVGAVLRRMGRVAGRNERVDGVPADPDTATQQDECGKAHYNTAACRTQLAKDSISVAVAKIDAERNEKDPNRVGQGC